MKLKLKTNWIIGLIIICYVGYITTLCFRGISNPFYTFSLRYVNYIDTLKPIDAVVPDSVSYKKYNHLKDSIAIVRNLKNGDLYLRGFATNCMNLFGTWSSLYCTNCSLTWFNKHIYNLDGKSPERYYIKLPGWKLNIKTTNTSTDTFQNTAGIDSVQFYVENGKSYIRKLIPAQPYPRDNHDIKYRMVDMPVKFSYHRYDQSLMIPINKSTSNTISVIILVVAISLAVYMLTLILLFIRFIIDVSKGRSFTDRNVGSLRLIAMSLLLYPVAVLLFNLLMKLVFYSYFIPDLILKDGIMDYWKVIGLGVIFLMLYKAFNQGKLLKEDRDLTV